MADIDEQRRDIREGLAEAIREYYKHHFSGFLTEPQRLLFSDAILKWEADHGAVLKVEGEFPPNLWKHSYQEGQQSMLNDGYTKTDSLVAPEGQQDSEVPARADDGPDDALSAGDGAHAKSPSQ